MSWWRNVTAVFAFLLVTATGSVSLRADDASDCSSVSGSTKIDLARVVEACRRQAEAGDAVAQDQLAYLYQKGLGVSQDHASALKWYLKAAEQGNTDAETNVGAIYRWGIGTHPDYAKAKLWLEKAADKGAPLAQFNLARMYGPGINVLPQDDVKRATLYRKAADQGFPLAQMELGDMYLRGIGVQQDYVQAYMWTSLAAASGEHS